MHFSHRVSFLGSALLLSLPFTASAQLINELSINTDSTDWEFVEIAGVAGVDLSALTLLVIESDPTGTTTGTSPGRIDRFVSLSGVIPADGYWWAASPAGQAAYGATCGTADGSFADNGFENSGATYLLVANFSGAVGSDVDSNDDGVVDTTFWTAVVDSVAVHDDATGDYNYGPGPVLGPDGSFLPAGVQRLPDSAVVNPGATVTVEAIVIGDYQLDDQLDGFFIQEEDADADADPGTSEGIFVFCGSCADAVSVGDLVEVTGIGHADSRIRAHAVLPAGPLGAGRC